MHSGVEKRVLNFELGFDASAVIARFIEREIKATEELVLMSGMKRILVK
jgi:hypothetical protein